MSKLILEVKNCQDCPFCESRRLFTADPFDTEYTYFCTKTNKVIAEYIGPFDKMPDIPDSCPIKAD